MQGPSHIFFICASLAAVLLLQGCGEQAQQLQAQLQNATAVVQTHAGNAIASVKQTVSNAVSNAIASGCEHAVSAALNPLKQTATEQVTLVCNAVPTQGGAREKCLTEGTAKVTTTFEAQRPEWQQACVTKVSNSTNLEHLNMETIKGAISNFEQLQEGNLAGVLQAQSNNLIKQLEADNGVSKETGSRLYEKVPEGTPSNYANNPTAFLLPSLGVLMMLMGFAALGLKRFLATKEKEHELLVVEENSDEEEALLQ